MGSAEVVVQQRATEAEGLRSKRERPVAGGGKEASRSAGVQKKKKATAAPVSASKSVAAAAYVEEEDVDALDCGVCFQPLKPPIFQCSVGHVVCSPCHDKLKATGKCHVCGMVTGGYSRCHAMERLLECIRVHCPNAAHGCTTRPAYHEQHSHCQTCPHTPCHCPGEACSFSGSIGALLDHIAAVHSWPCTTKIKASDKCKVRLRDGFNFLVVANQEASSNQGDTATPATSNQWLVLVNVVRQPLDRVISVHCIHPHANFDVKEMQCYLQYSKFRFRQGGDD